MVKGFLHIALTCYVSAVTVYADSSDQNCQVTSWDPWQTCDPLTNTQTRQRYVKVAPTGNGLACPELVETIDCFMNAFVMEANAQLPLILEADAISSPSISTFIDQTGPRADGIAAVKGQIANNPRQVMVGGSAYPYFYGPPMWKTGSLNDQIQIQEVLRFSQYQTNQSQTMAGIAYLSASQLTSMQAISMVYSQSPTVGFDIPMSTDNSDSVFGLQRLTHKSFVLRVVKSLEFPTSQFTITSQQATQRCGTSIDQLRLQSRLYVEDFSTFSKWNDPTQPQKYVPSSIAFYCYDPTKHVLLPIEIRLLDTQLVYTPFDSVNDWTLAKMAVETAANNYHSVYHMIATHGTMIPIRVELVRTMAPNHPVRVLLERHSAYDFALERLAAVQLFNTSTLLDQHFGWGATGSIRFMSEIGQYRLSVRNTFKKDVIARGLDLFGADHKYVTYASKYWDVIQAFVEKYVKVYYPTTTEMINDSELQRWAQNCAKIPQLRDFPSTIVCQNCLRDLLTHLIFTNTLTHHGMNGASTWMGMSAPYSPAALWKPLPTAKNTALNLMEYTIPVTLIPGYIALVGFFARPSPDIENFMNAYSVSPFKDEIALQTPINEFKQGLQAIEDAIVATEQGKAWPYMTLRPSRLPFTSWI